MNNSPQSPGIFVLPARPNLEYLKNLAKQRLAEMRRSNAQAGLSAAQLAVARDYGFKSWRALRMHVLARARGAADTALLREQALQRTAIVLDSASLERFVGVYQLAPDRLLTITRQAERLFVQLTGQPKVSLLAESPTKFSCDDVAAQISFEADGHGLMLHQNGHEHFARRIDPAEAGKIAQRLARRISDGVAMAGSEQAVRHQIESMMQRDGCPDYAEMTEALAEVSRRQRSALKWQFAELGALQEMVFSGVGAQGWDIYQARFAHGVLVLRICLDEQGKISGFLLQSGP